MKDSLALVLIMSVAGAIDRPETLSVCQNQLWQPGAHVDVVCRAVSSADDSTICKMGTPSVLLPKSVLLVTRSEVRRDYDVANAVDPKGARGAILR